MIKQFIPERTAFLETAVVESLATLAIVLVCLIVLLRILRAMFLEFYSQRRYGVWCYRFVILPSAVSCSPGSWPLNIRYRLFYVRNAFWIGENYSNFQLYWIKHDKKHCKLLKIDFLFDKYCSDNFLIIKECKIYFIIMQMRIYLGFGTV